MSDQGEADYLLKMPTSKNVMWQDREPLVFLFGWAGCQNRYLDKYAQFYNLQGCITCQYTAPNEVLFWQQDRIKGLTETMAKEILDGFGEHPILFHVFSNGGCSVLLPFLRYCQTLNQQPTSSTSPNSGINLRGLVFDSSPARGDQWTKARAYTEAAHGKQGPFVKMLLIGAFSTFFTIWNWYQWIKRWIYGQPPPYSLHPYMALPKLDLRCPMLFIYSKADAICKYQSIEAFMEKQRRRGVKVTPIRFNDSKHCQHGKIYPNEYNEAVKTFLYEVVESSPPSKKTRSKSGDAENGEDFVKIGEYGNEKASDLDDFEMAEKE